MKRRGKRLVDAQAAQSEATQDSALAGDVKDGGKSLDPTERQHSELARKSLEHERTRHGRTLNAPLMFVLLASASGIMLDRWLEVPVLNWIYLFTATLLAAIAIPKKSIANIALTLAIIGLAGAWHHSRWFLFAENDLASFAEYSPRPAAVRGTVVSLPEVRPAPAFDPLQIAAAEERTQFELRATAIRVDDAWIPAGGECSVVVEGRCENYLPGDQVQIFGQLSRQQPPGNPGEFDFAADHRAENRLTALRATHVETVGLIQAGSSFNFARLIAQTRLACRKTIETYLPKQQAGFAAALLIGERHNLGATRRDDFLLTNSMHFLAISGLHIGILAAGLFALLRVGWVPRRWALVAVVLVTFVYLAISGAKPPAVRSFILIGIACGALAMHRSFIGLNGLSLAGLIVLVINPSDLFRVGPQLSFLAVLTLMVVAPLCGRIGTTDDPLQQLIRAHEPRAKRAWRWLAVLYLRGTLISFAVWLVTLPLVAARFHLVSPIASPLSPLLWPLIAMALFAGFGLLLFGAWAEPLAQICGWFCQQLLSVIDWCVAHGAEIPSGHFWVSGPDDWWLAGFYAICVTLLIRLSARTKVRLLAIPLAVWLGIGAIDAATLTERPVGTLRCTVLSMRHGCCVVVELPDRRVLVYDAGRLGSPRGAVQSVSGFLWDRGIGHIDKLVISHDDADHYNAIPKLLQRQFEFVEVHTPPGMLKGNLSAATSAVRSALENHRIDVIEINSGQQLLTSTHPDHPYSVRVLHPPQQEFEGSDNAHSVVLLIEYAGHRILLPGDLEPPGLEMLLSRHNVDCDFLLAPHHGSRSSDPPGFAAWCQPEITVISGGRGSSTEEVIQDYQNAGSTVLHTAERGAVSYVIESNGDATFTTHRPAETRSPKVESPPGS